MSVALRDWGDDDTATRAGFTLEGPGPPRIFEGQSSDTVVFVRGS